MGLYNCSLSQWNTHDFLWQHVCWSANMVRYLLICTWNFSPHLMFSAASGEGGSSSLAFMYTRFIFLSCISISQFFRCNLLWWSVMWKLFHSSVILVMLLNSFSVLMYLIWDEWRRDKPCTECLKSLAPWVYRGQKLMGFCLLSY